MNVGRRREPGSNPIDEAKAVLKEARLLRITTTTISPRSSSSRTQKGNKKVRDSSWSSTASSNDSIHSFPLLSFAKIKTEKSPHRLPDNVGDIVQELKHIKHSIMEDMKMTKDIDINLHSRIQSFMEACNLVLNQFDRQLEYDIDVHSKEFGHLQQKKEYEDDTKRPTMPRRKSSLRTQFRKLKSLSSSSENSSVRFDLSQNEIFG